MSRRKVLTESQAIQKLNFFLDDGMSLTEAEYLDKLIAEIDEEIAFIDEELESLYEKGGLGALVKGAYHGINAYRNDKAYDKAIKKGDHEKAKQKMSKYHHHKTQRDKMGAEIKAKAAERQKEQLAKKREQLAKQRQKLDQK